MPLSHYRIIEIGTLPAAAYGAPYAFLNFGKLQIGAARCA